jgi:hypothetical protein
VIEQIVIVGHRHLRSSEGQLTTLAAGRRSALCSSCTVPSLERLRSALSRRIGPAACLVVGAGLGAPPALAADGIDVLVVREHGVGTAAQAQPHVDKLVGLAARRNGWPTGRGKYVTTRAAAIEAAASGKPRYGIFSLGAFLGLREKLGLAPIGRVAARQAGGQQYHLVSRSAHDAAGCKGKKVATDHGDDARFIDRVVARGAFRLADFTLVMTKRPLQTVKKVALGEAECALVDDAQLESIAHIEEAKGVRSVWASDRLPPMVVVAFPSAPAAERAAFQASLGKLCEGDGKASCDEVGIVSIGSATAADLAPLVTAYGG